MKLLVPVPTILMANSATIADINYNSKLLTVCRHPAKNKPVMYTYKLVRQPVPYRFEPRQTYSTRVFIHGRVCASFFSAHVVTPSHLRTHARSADVYDKSMVHAIKFLYPYYYVGIFFS